MDFNSVVAQVTPLYTQLNFWLTVGLTVLIWYVVAAVLAHILFGAGRRNPVESARQGMGMALLLLLVALACGAYFLFRPADLIYMVAVSLTFLVLALLVFALFSRLGAEK
ncbi:hypothetical protein [Deinococcus sp.]|uniref:hypothetical protein n=1 Tax=Deinococcus sp. TaxID=47478 RepID=UPI003B5C987A